MNQIAATAVIDKTTRLGDGVTIGPGCVIGENAVIGDGCQLKANVVVGAGVAMGRDNRVFPFCTLGEEPQIVGQSEPATDLVIGDSNTFRENVTINRGSPKSYGKTVIGNENYFMIGAHLGHDVEVEDNVLLGNYCQISGHCKIERNVWMNALSGMHQFVTIGRFAYTAGNSGMSHDVPPFVKVSGIYPCRVRAINTIGLRRAGLSDDQIKALNDVFRKLYRQRGGALAQRVAELIGEGGHDENVRDMLDSLERSSKHRFGRARELLRDGH